MYNYYEAVKDDVLQAIADNYSPAEIAERLEDRTEFEEELNDTLWTNDAVTGNGSGSYTFSRALAADYVNDNNALLLDMIADYGITAEEVGRRFIAHDWEWFDVSIRCYVLGAAISEALDDLEEEMREMIRDKVHFA